MASETAEGLTRAEINLLVKKFVGIGGDESLRHFTHTQLAEFLEFECDVAPRLIVPEHNNSKATRLFGTLEACDPSVQANILRNLLVRVESRDGDAQQQQARVKLEAALVRLEGNAVDLAEPEISSSENVRLAIDEARTLLESHGASSAVDRVHTALHGHLAHLLTEADIAFHADDTIQRMYKLLLSNHPRFQLGTELAGVQTKLVGGMTAAIDAINQLRNDWSRAHPNEDLHPRLAALAIELVSVAIRDLDRALAP